MENAASFWAWVVACSADLDAMRDADAPFFDLLAERLGAIDARLGIEFSDPTDGVRDLIITAYGDRDAFAAADAVVGAAPSLPGWRVLALKPALGFEFVHRRGSVVFDPAHMWFLPMTSASNPADLGVRVGLPGAAGEHPERDAAVWTILSTGLGERGAATAIARVDTGALPADPAGAGYIELPLLPKYIAWHASRGGA